MFALSLRSLDGGLRRITPGPSTTVAELRAAVEQDLPAFREVRLLHGAHEVGDDSMIEVELQVVVVISPAKALDALEAALEEEDGQTVTAALTSMEMLEDLEVCFCERIMQILKRNSEGQVAEDVLSRLGAILGCKCDKPQHFATSLTVLLEDILGSEVLTTRRQGYPAACAGFEIAVRCGECLPSILRSALVRWAGDTIAVHGCEVQFDFYSADKIPVGPCLCASGLIGLLGEEKHCDLLMSLERLPDLPENVMLALREAVCQVYSRMKQADVHDATQEVNGVGAVRGADEADNMINVEGIDPLEETDVGLEEALGRSDLDALMQEQRDLQASILQSKADAPQACHNRGSTALSTCQADQIVLLCFKRCPKELIDALLASPLAVRLAAHGVELQPDWAGRRLIFAAGLTEAATSEALQPWNVAVYAADEKELLETVRTALGHNRPRLKDGVDGRSFLPRDISLFDDVSLREVVLGTQAHRAADFDADAEARNELFVVSRTFWELRPSSPAAPPRGSASAPAGV